MNLNRLNFQEIQPFFKALGNETRFEIVCLLIERPRTVTEICKTLRCQQTKISNDLKCLRDCGYVHTKKDGNNRIYSLDAKLEPVMALLSREILNIQKICIGCPLCRKNKKIYEHHT